MVTSTLLVVMSEAACCHVHVLHAMPFSTAGSSGRIGVVCMEGLCQYFSALLSQRLIGMQKVVHGHCVQLWSLPSCVLIHGWQPRHES